MPTGWRYSSAWWNGSGAGPHSPAHPTHAALRPSMTDSMADTRPPGLRSQVLSPPSSITRSTGRRFAATTRSNVGPATVTSHHHLLRGSLSSLRRLEQPRSGNEEVPRTPSMCRLPATDLAPGLRYRGRRGSCATTRDTAYLLWALPETVAQEHARNSRNRTASMGGRHEGSGWGPHHPCRHTGR